MKKNSSWYPFIFNIGSGKFLLTMKLTFLIMLLSVLEVSASVYSQDTRLSLSVDQVSFRETLKLIEKESDYRFFYNDELTDLNKMVSLKVTDKKVGTILDQLLANSGITYQVLDNHVIVLTPVSSPVQNQPHKVTGTILDENGEPMLGVTVIDKTTGNGTVTDLDGKYSIDVSGPKDVLIYSFVGYKSLTMTVGTQAVFDLSMETDLLNLDEVIVTAYSEKAKTEISSAVAFLKADEIDKVTVNSVTDMLTGKVAGVQVQTASGQPGQAGDIRIRGVGSIFSPQTPLVVVDGVIGGTYNPNDIESVSILKDAGATGLYGSQAASGVILITTKSGNSAKGEITAKITRGIKRPEFGNFQVMNSRELYSYQKMIYSPTLFATIRPKTLLARDYDWIGNTYKQSDITTAYFSASGGGEKTNYYLSVDLMDDNGTLITTNYKRLSVRSKVRYLLTDRLTITTNISGEFNKSRYPHWTLAEGAFRLMPWDLPYDDNGDPVYDIKKAGWYSNVTNNPYHSLQYNKYDNFGVNGFGSFSLNYRLTSWLKIDSRTSLSTSHGKYEEIESPLSYEGASVNGRIMNSVSFDMSYSNTSLLKFDKTFGVHSISGLAGVEGGKYMVESDFGGNATGILPGQEVIGVAGSVEKPVGFKAECSRLLHALASQL